VIVIITADPTDRRLIERALVLLDQAMRLDGSRLPMSLHGPVNHIQTSLDRLEPTDVHTGGAGAHDAPMTLLLTYEDAAVRVPCSVRTLERAVAEGTLPAKRLGRRVLFAPTDLAAWTDQLPTSKETA
jgi:excisionase family DNA binding protein